MEYEVQSALEYEFRRNGAEGPGYPSIVGSGPFSTVLHYDKGTRRMEAGDVVVVDVGAPNTADTLATLPERIPFLGKFTARQREIYRKSCSEARKAAIAAVRPGATLARIHAAAFDYIRSKGGYAEILHSWDGAIISACEVHDVGSTARPLNQTWSSQSSPESTFRKKSSASESRTTL